MKRQTFLNTTLQAYKSYLFNYLNFFIRITKELLVGLKLCCITKTSAY